MIIGNSSSGIREGSSYWCFHYNRYSFSKYWISTKKLFAFRERGPNVIDVNYNSNEILKGI